MKRGFTMVELIAVVIIMATMSLVTFISYNTIIKNTEISKEKDLVRSIIIEANMLYNDYVLKDKQNQLINIDIYSLMMTDDKPQYGSLLINEYGNVAIAVKIEDRCYKKNYDSNAVDLIDNDTCKID